MTVTYQKHGHITGLVPDLCFTVLWCGRVMSAVFMFLPGDVGSAHWLSQVFITGFLQDSEAFQIDVNSGEQQTSWLCSGE